MAPTAMTVDFKGYRIVDDIGQVDFGLATAWLATSYWSPGITQEEVEHGARHSSLVIGARSRDDGAFVGYARVASDRTRFGYIMDVFVEPRHRRQGLAEAMVRFALDHPDHQLVYLWMLATADAHAVYEKVGFGPLPDPTRVMALRKPWPRPLVR